MGGHKYGLIKKGPVPRPLKYVMHIITLKVEMTWQR